MKERFLMLLILFLTSFNSVICQSRILEEKLDSLIYHKEYASRACSKFIIDNLDLSICFLIDKITLDNKSIIGFQDIESSYLAPNPNVVGINALYYLEIILRDSLKIDNDLTEIRIFNKCVLVSAKNKNRPLNIDDLNYLKSVYMDWYNKTHNYSLNKRKEVWKEEYQQIIHAKYEWI